MSDIGDGYPPHDVTHPPCSVCGEPADAYWAGENEIGICRTCAPRVCAALVIDAMPGPDVTPGAWMDRVAGMIRTMEGQMYRAAAHRLQRELRRRERPALGIAHDDPGWLAREIAADDGDDGGGDEPPPRTVGDAFGHDRP